jgi:hypothetical protein
MKRITPVLLIAVLWMSACANAGSAPPDPPLQITTSSFTPAVVGKIYVEQLQASGGPEPVYSWSLVSGNLPPGITLSTSGVLSGIPTSSGTFNFVIQVMSSKSAAQTLKIEWRTS